MGYSPLGSSADRAPVEHGCVLLQHPVVTSIAQELAKSPAQVLIRYGVQRFPNMVSIPKSSNPARLAQNIDVLCWELTADQMQLMCSLDCDFRYFISYLKKPENDLKWHEAVIEHGDER